MIKAMLGNGGGRQRDTFALNIYLPLARPILPTLKTTAKQGEQLARNGEAKD
jgi:hypothetical protein